ncbi:MAG: LacI family DNA-binding transcriptional regulator [Devosia sp.]|uniref:LacI family DNA-binding transcriptional regulator n=1 Tax=Devosia sp. TaxID=1871048 RepID=UPI001A461197|nr:LacI family DNA-binding transcriptional regulator [Devosia sp.]MBL8598305.1 LacI family DNA-binding transcriptional regulator [Devosia sp.]
MSNTLPPARATIRDVARIAGMSTASVSRTLKDPDSVRPETRRKVAEAAQSLGYRLNRMAIDFRTGRSHTIMVLVPNIANPFYSAFFKGIEEAALERGYIVLIGDTDDDEFRETGYFGMVASGRCDGLIAHIGKFPSEFATLIEAGTLGVPVVSCNPDAGIEVPTVRVDNYQAAQLAAEHLLSLGHRRFGQVVAFMQYRDSQTRRTSFVEAITKAGASWSDEMEIAGDLTIASGRAAARKLMSSKTKPTAIFALNDEMAIGVVHELEAMGYRVPQDVSVVGFDDVDIAGAFSPALTTLRVPRRSWGNAACVKLLDLLDGRSVSADTVLGTELVIRESTGPAHNR